MHVRNVLLFFLCCVYVHYVHVDTELHCPKCRKVTSLSDGGVDSLPVNYALKDVIEVMPDDAALSFSPSTPVTSLGHSLGGMYTSMCVCVCCVYMVCVCV